MHYLSVFLISIFFCGIISIDQSTVSRAGNATSVASAAAAQRCLASYGHRENFNASRKELPPLLLSAPGSGNTWVRLLLEAATGIRTGSVYGDDEIAKYLPGEWYCNTSQLIIKAHFPFIPPMPNYEKCLKGGLETIDRAVVLHREPFQSFFSEYQRSFNEKRFNAASKHGQDSNTHIVGIPVDEFRRENFMSSVSSQARLFEQMFEMIFERISSSKHARRRKKELELWQRPESYHFIRYEDLVNPVTKESSLSGVLGFLHSVADIDRIRCAFLSANRAHRTHSANEVTFQLAWTPEAVCTVWHIMGMFSLKLGYTRPPGDYVCRNGIAFPLNGTACKDGIMHCGGGSE